MGPEGACNRLNNPLALISLFVWTTLLDRPQKTKTTFSLYSSNKIKTILCKSAENQRGNDRM